MLWQKKNSIGRFFFIVTVLSLAVGLNGCSGNAKYSEERAVIGTYVKVDVCRKGHSTKDLKAALDAVWQRFEEVEQRMNAYDSDSDIGRINEAQGQPVSVHKDVYQLIQYGCRLSEQTRGAFDITVRSLIDMWQEAEEQNKMPTDEQIQSVLAKIGVNHLRFPGPASELKVACDDGCRIDLGGIAKGYAVDEAARILRDRGMNNFLIDAGGDMYASGHNCLNHDWRIAIQHPRKQNEWADVIEVSNMAVTTSGDYEQFYEVQGKFFSHIMNPHTGYPQKDIVSATVIAPTAVEADAFSTALTLWTPQESLNFIDKLGKKYGTLVIEEKDGQLKYFPSANYKHWKSLKFGG